MFNSFTSYLTIKSFETPLIKTSETKTSNKERTRSNNTNYNGMDGLIHE